MFNVKRLFIVLFVFYCMSSIVLGFNWGYFCPNGDFESNSNWTLSGASYSTNYAHSGSRSCEITAANGYCSQTFSVTQDSDHSGDMIVHMLGFFVKNTNSTAQTLTLSYFNSYDASEFTQTFNLGANQDWTQQNVFVCIPSGTSNVTLTLTGSASSIYIDQVTLCSYPINGSFELDQSDDITSGIKDTIPGFWQRGVTVQYFSGQADYFTRGCVWATVNKNDVVNGNTDGSRVGLLALPKADGVFSQTFKGINFWREFQFPVAQFNPYIGNEMYVSAQCKVWTDTGSFSGVTAALIVHKLNVVTNEYSSVTTIYLCTNTPQIITTPEVDFSSANEYGWVEINLLYPSYTSNKVMYVDEEKTFIRMDK